MPNPVPPTNPDGSLRPYTQDEIDLMEIRHVGVDDGRHPTHIRRPDDCTVTREYFCAFGELESFLCMMLGTSIIYDNPLDSDNPTLSRLLPQMYPGKPQIRAVALEEATGFRFTGEQEDDGLPIYDQWLCRFVYQHCPFQLEADEDISSEHKRYVIEQTSKPQADRLTFPSGIMKYVRPGGGVPNGSPIQHNVGIELVQVEVRKQWLKIPYDGWKEGSILRKRVFGDMEADERPYLGTVNKTQIFGYAPGQLLLTGVEDALEFDPLGNGQFWNITYIWLAKPNGHNWLYFYHPDGTNNGWYFVSNDGNEYTAGGLPDGVSLFDAREHLDLFKVGNP